MDMKAILTDFMVVVIAVLFADWVYDKFIVKH